MRAGPGLPLETTRVPSPLGICTCTAIGQHSTHFRKDLKITKLIAVRSLVVTIESQNLILRRDLDPESQNHFSNPCRLAMPFRCYLPGGDVQYCRNLYELEYYKMFTSRGWPVFLNLQPASVMDVREICVGDRLALRQYSDEDIASEPVEGEQAWDFAQVIHVSRNRNKPHNSAHDSVALCIEWMRGVENSDGVVQKAEQDFVLYNFEYGSHWSMFFPLMPDEHFERHDFFVQLVRDFDEDLDAVCEFINPSTSE